MPPTFPEGSVAELRSKIGSMTNVRGTTTIRHPRKSRSPKNKKNSEWSREKQAEHEITRNKMKRLLGRKRKKILSDSSPPSLGSIQSRSVMEFSSPSVSATDLKSEASNVSISNPDDSAIKAFFEPPETVAEMERRRKELVLAPSTIEELNAIKARRGALLKTKCKVCNCKLKPVEQQMPCACSYVFCKQHRKPDAHLCNIDHRQRGRSKIDKENPKLVFGGLHKAKMSPHS
ncbi:hypothetical protein KIN20_018664 [Parelaphostrongylus tenuis]|uniref:AN1-type domain-containing protein n=1 Tax=Parelaphostrongylus tenuis TaxID=148309 RepID=A0AAD5QRQ3_PARTN|nr:hypothetical protein KIN20_018664 [Parelaphostrongylus tenuis]